MVVLTCLNEVCLELFAIRVQLMVNFLFVV